MQSTKSVQEGGFVAGKLWQRFYHLLLETLPDAAFAQDESGRIITANKVAEQLTGFTHQEFTGRNIRQLFTTGSAERISLFRAKALEGDLCFSTEADLLRREGPSVLVSLQARGLKEPGSPVIFQYVCRPVQVAAPVDDSRQHEARFRLMAKNLTEMVLAYDMDRRLTFANAAAETLTGYSVSELEQRQFICWVHTDDRERMLNHWDRLFEGKSFYEEEYKLVTRDGRM
jgi:PAS domain S-box-containing protein